MNVFVLYERDLQDKEDDVIGVISSKDKLNDILENYYGNYTILSTNNSEMIYSIIIETESYNKTKYKVEIYLLPFKVK